MLTMASFASCGGASVQPTPAPPPPPPGNERADPPAEPPVEAPVDSPVDSPVPVPVPVDAQLSVSPQSGEAGTSVTLDARGLPPDAMVTIGFGPPQSQYETLAHVVVDADSTLLTTARVPDWAEADRRYVFVADGPGSLAVAEFTVTAAEDPPERAEVTGMLTDEGVECPALRADNGELFTLAGDAGSFTVGDRVTVVGTIAETSICMQGTTIRVESIRAGGGGV